MPDLRKDPVSGRWIIVATDRAKRPEDLVGRNGLGTDDHEDKPEYREDCPFCLGNEAQTPPEIVSIQSPGDQSPWSARVVPNRFPALVTQGEPVVRRHGMYQYLSGIGSHEVVIETARHNLEPYELPVDRLGSVIEIYRDRMSQLERDRRFEYVTVFRNHGKGAGASLSHPHSQIIASPLVPLTIEEELRHCRDYYEFTSSCVVCDIIKEELNMQERLVLVNSDFVIFAPYASRVPFEIWIVPREHASSFTTITDVQAKDLARCLARVLYAFAEELGDPDYNFYIHTSPARVDDVKYYHWHLEILPKLTVPAGFELGTGIYINVTSPEASARFLRQKLTIEGATSP